MSCTRLIRSSGAPYGLISSPTAMGLSEGVAAKAAGICWAKAAADAAAKNVLRSITCLGSIVGFQTRVTQAIVLNLQCDSAKRQACSFENSEWIYHLTFTTRKPAACI